MIPHEPECECAYVEPGECTCLWLRRAYQRGYLQGYNGHATAALEWKATHGAYPQHGKGENP